MAVRLAGGIACTRFAMKHDNERSCASRVEFESYLMGGFRYLRRSAVCGRGKRKMVKGGA
jgi:hypothetical protein